MREILVVRSDEVGVELLRRQPDETWPEQALLLGEGMLSLESIGFARDVAAFYRGTGLLPPSA